MNIYSAENGSIVTAERSGLTFHLEGTWYEISGPEGVVSCGSADTEGKTEDEIRDMVSRHFLKFIEEHTVKDNFSKCFKAVAYSAARGDYIQPQAIKPDESGCVILQEYNSSLVFIRERELNCRYYPEAEQKIKEMFDVQTGLPVEVYKSGDGDCSNGGISSERNRLYIIGKGFPFMPKDIRECVKLESKEVGCVSYVNAKPLYFPKRWYMMGGNFIYTTDSRFSEMTGIRYPIPVHDRYEGKR